MIYLNRFNSSGNGIAIADLNSQWLFDSFDRINSPVFLCELISAFDTDKPNFFN